MDIDQHFNLIFLVLAVGALLYGIFSPIIRASGEYSLEKEACPGGIIPANISLENTEGGARLAWVPRWADGTKIDPIPIGVYILKNPYRWQRKMVMSMNYCQKPSFWSGSKADYVCDNLYYSNGSEKFDITLDLAGAFSNASKPYQQTRFSVIGAECIRIIAK